MFPRVTRVRHLEGYRLEVAFNDQTVKVVDLEGELYGEVFEPLKGIAFFKRAELNPETGTVEWPNGADFAPEFLHEIGREAAQAA